MGRLSDPAGSDLAGDDCARPGRIRRWVLRPLAWSLAAIAVLLFVLQLLADTPAAREWARQWIVAELETLLGRHVELGAVEIELLPFTAHLWQLEIGGLAPAPGEGTIGAETEPFLELPYGLVEADLDALRDRRIHLHRLRLERPTVYLHFWGEGDNLLRARGDDGAWEVFIDQIEIDRARLALDQESIRISLDGDAVRARFQGSGDRRLGGRLSARGVDVMLPHARRALTVAAALGVEIDRDGLRLVDSSWSGDGTAGTLGGSCQFRGPERKCVIDARGHAEGRLLGEIGWFDALRGRVDVDGALTWRPGSSGWRSTIDIPRATLWRRQLDDARGELVGDKYGLRLELESARYAGGTVDGTVVAALREDTKPLSAELDFVDLRVDTMLADQQIPVDGLAARAAGRLDYRVALVPAGPRASTDRRGALGDAARRGNGRGELRLTPDAEQAGLAIEGDLPFRIEGGTVHLEAVSLRADRQSLLARGAIDLPERIARFDFEIETNDAGELASLLPLDDATLGSATTPGAPWLPTAGRGQIAGQLVFEPDAPHAELRLRLQDVRTSRIAVARAAGTFRVERVALEDLQLDLGDADQALTLRGRVPFDTTAGPAQLTLDTFRWPMDEIEPWLPFDLAIDGAVTGRVDLRLPAALTGLPGGDPAPGTVPLEPALGDLSLVVEPARVLGLPLDALDVDMAWRGQQLSFRKIAARAPAGTLAAAGTVDLPPRLPIDLAQVAVDLRLRTAGARLDAAPLAALRPRDDLEGTLDARAHVSGRLAAPDLELELGLPYLALTGDPEPGGSSHLVASSRDGRLNVEGRLLDAVRFAGDGRLALVAHEGGLTLDDDRSHLALTLEGDDLATLLQLVAGPFGDRGDGAALPVDGSFRAALDADGRGALLQIEQASVRLADRELTPREPFSATLDASGWRLRPSAWFETGRAGMLRLAGRGGWGADAPLDLRAEATLDADWLEIPMPELETGGRLRLEGALHGTRAAPRFTGRLDAEDVSAALPELDERLTNLQGRVLLEDRVAAIESLSGDFGGGRLEIDGSIDLRDTAPRLQLQLDGRGVTLADVAGWRVGGDADLSLRGGVDDLLLSGRTELDELVYRDDLRFDLAQLVRDMLRGRRLEVEDAESMQSKVRLEVQVAGADALEVRNNLADLRGETDLLLRGTLAEPVLLGEVTVTPGGNLVWNGSEFEIERARMVFADPFRLVPQVDLVATTRVRDFDVTLALAGELERLETSFSSEPPLPDVEVVRLLAGGESYVEPTASADPRLQRLEQEQSSGAATFLYGQAASVIGERVNNLFGFDKFRIDPLTGTDADGLSKARVTVGKRLHKDVFVTYSVDPSSTENQRLQVEWRLSDSLTLVLIQNGDDSYSADARWESTF
ncbi:MAG: translocation/assembly module TamB domain-containing protein [Acidobacteriota bacterium]